MRIKHNEIFSPDNFVTGAILALKGVVDIKGIFEVKDYCYAGIPFNMNLPRSINTATKRGLYDNLNENREFVAFVSGLEFGEPGDVLSTELLLRFLRGEMFDGHKNSELASKITRVIICGNSIV